jgi:electron transport complex protein RnfB
VTKQTWHALADSIDAALPQSQCRRCGHDGCRPYAEAVASGAPLNRCPPGGTRWSRRSRRSPGVPSFRSTAAWATASRSRSARIDEAACIGCTLCIDACPVDAIAGAAKRMHTVLPALCTGCALCIPPCPVDCITMVPAGRVWGREDARRRASGHVTLIDRRAKDPTRTAVERRHAHGAETRTTPARGAKPRSRLPSFVPGRAAPPSAPDENDRGRSPRPAARLLRHDDFRRHRAPPRPFASTLDALWDFDKPGRLRGALSRRAEEMAAGIAEAQEMRTQIARTLGLQRRVAMPHRAARRHRGERSPSSRRTCASGTCWSAAATLNSSGAAERAVPLFAEALDARRTPTRTSSTRSTQRTCSESRRRPLSVLAWNLRGARTREGGHRSACARLACVAVQQPWLDLLR